MITRSRVDMQGNEVRSTVTRWVIPWQSPFLRLTGCWRSCCPRLLNIYIWKATKLTKQPYSRGHDLEAFACPLPRVLGTAFRVEKLAVLQGPVLMLLGIQVNPWASFLGIDFLSHLGGLAGGSSVKKVLVLLSWPPELLELKHLVSCKVTGS